MSKKLKQRVPKLNKQQIAQQMRQIEEAKKGKRIVSEILYPILTEHATTIANSERITEIFKVVIMQAMQIPFKDKTIGDLDFSSMLNDEKDDKSKAIFVACVEGFKDIKIADTVKILNEYEGGVNAYLQNELKTREFKSLKLEDLLGE